MNKKLAAAIARDDRLEDAGMHADDRQTCYRHRSWADECADRHAPLTAGRVLAEALEIDRIRLGKRD
ncbi:hypothetical protein [Streptomyces sp. NPDC020667]|uniref:hypothetical protein n=1 Tax=Streptomyces sp. NPDC020667 TaxID=3154895 RepID=UPI0033EFC5A2